LGIVFSPYGISKYFHQKTSQSRRKKIESITDPMGTNHTDQEEIEQIFVDHFKNLFTSQNTTRIIETT
jgi:hypothetical protein